MPTSVDGREFPASALLLLHPVQLFSLDPIAPGRHGGSVDNRGDRHPSPGRQHSLTREVILVDICFIIDQLPRCVGIPNPDEIIEFVVIDEPVVHHPVQLGKSILSSFIAPPEPDTVRLMIRSP